MQMAQTRRRPGPRNQRTLLIMTFEDRIEVARVRIWRNYPPRSVVMADLKQADRLLDSWQREAFRKVECRIHIRFEDGFELEGSYLVGARRRRPSLSLYLRDGLRGIVSGRGHSAQVAGIGTLRIPEHVASKSRFDLYCLTAT
jgi:hypothetical protein